MPYGVFDCSYVGVLYLCLAFFSGILGFGFSACMSYELLFPYDFMNDEFYYVCVTSHAVMMVFFFLTVSAGGFFNILLPGLLFCSDFFFPSVNLFSIFLLFMSFFLVVVSLFVGGVGTGWTLYPPLSSFAFGGSVDIFMVSVHFFTVSSVLSSINVLCTVFFFKCSSVRYLDLGVFVWSAVVTSFLNVLSLPYFSSALTMLLLDSSFNTVFFNPVYGGDPLLFQSLFWFWGHPEVYMLVIPVFGLISLIVGYLMDNEFIFGHYCVIVSLMSMGFLGFLVWGHHMVTVGWSSDLKSFFMASTVAMSMPTGLKVFNWVSSLYFYGSFSNINNVFFYFVFVFIVFFVMGGSSGIILSNYSADVLLHDTYFVVGHFHFVLSLASFMGFVAALVFFWPVITGGHHLDYDLVIVYLIGFFFFSFFTFLPFHFLGTSGCPSSVFCYSDGFFSWFYFSSLGFMGLTFNLFFLVFILSISLNMGLVFLYVFLFFYMGSSLFVFYIVLGFLIVSFFYIFIFCYLKSGSYSSEDSKCDYPLYVELAGNFTHSNGVDPCQSESAFKTANWDFYKDGVNAYSFHSKSSLKAFFCILAKASVPKLFAKQVVSDSNDLKIFNLYVCLFFFSLIFLFFYIALDVLAYGDFSVEGKFFTFTSAGGQVGVFDSYCGRHLCTFNLLFVSFVNFSFFTFLSIVLPFLLFSVVFPGISVFFYFFCIFFCFLISSFDFLQLALLFLLSFISCFGSFFNLFFSKYPSFISVFYEHLKCFLLLFFFFIFASDGLKPALFMFIFIFLFMFIFFLVFNFVCFVFFLAFLPLKGFKYVYTFFVFFDGLLTSYYKEIRACFVFIFSFKFSFDGFVYKFMKYFFSGFFLSIKPCFKEIKGMTFKEFEAYFYLFFQFVVFFLMSSFFFGWLFYNFINESYFLFLGVFGIFACTGYYNYMNTLLEDVYKHNSKHFSETVISEFNDEVSPVSSFIIKFNWVYSMAWWYFLFSFLLLLTGLATSVYCNFTSGVVSLFFWTGFFLVFPYFSLVPFISIFFIYCFVYGTNLHHEVAFKCLISFLYSKGGLFFFVFFSFFFSRHITEFPFIKIFYLIILFLFDLFDFFIKYFGFYCFFPGDSAQNSNKSSLDFIMFLTFVILLILSYSIFSYFVFFFSLSPITIFYYMVCSFVLFVFFLFLGWYLHHSWYEDLRLLCVLFSCILFSVTAYMLMVLHVVFDLLCYILLLVPLNVCKDMSLEKCYFFLKMIYYFFKTIVSFTLLFLCIVVFYAFHLFLFLSCLVIYAYDMSCMLLGLFYSEVSKYFFGNK